VLFSLFIVRSFTPRAARVFLVSSRYTLFIFVVFSSSYFIRESSAKHPKIEIFGDQWDFIPSLVYRKVLYKCYDLTLTALETHLLEIQPLDLQKQVWSADLIIDGPQRQPIEPISRLSLGRGVTCSFLR